jgi:hypothetical protein
MLLTPTIFTHILPLIYDLVSDCCKTLWQHPVMLCDLPVTVNLVLFPVWVYQIKADSLPPKNTYTHTHTLKREYFAYCSRTISIHIKEFWNKKKLPDCYSYLGITFAIFPTEWQFLKIDEKRKFKFYPWKVIKLREEPFKYNS